MGEEPPLHGVQWGGFDSPEGYHFVDSWCKWAACQILTLVGAGSWPAGSTNLCGPVAQRTERVTTNDMVAGPTPAGTSIFT